MDNASTLDATQALTPQYVLLNKLQRIGPSVQGESRESGSAAIYGFSDRRFYDRFCQNSSCALVPYPLVQVYLRDQIAADAGDALIVLDAAGPEDPQIQATTVQAVLEAGQNRASHVAVLYVLSYDSPSKEYRLAAGLPKPPMTEAGAAESVVEGHSLSNISRVPQAFRTCRRNR